MTWRLFKYAQWLTRKLFLTSKLYKSANADIVVGSSRHTALATPRNIARPLRPITCCCRGFEAIISPNRTDWCIRMQRMPSTCCCIQIILYVAKCILFKYLHLNRKTFHRTSKTISCFTSHGVCTDVHQCLCSMFTNGILIENKCFIRASRHWQALFKRMNGQVIASV